MMNKTTIAVTGIIILVAGVTTWGLIGLFWPEPEDPAKDKNASTTQKAMDEIKKHQQGESATQKIMKVTKAPAPGTYDPLSGAIPKTLADANSVLVAQYVSTNITPAQVNAANDIVNAANAEGAYGLS